jgi:hypothetical protein
MSGLWGTIQDAIKSATYNPEAAKAIKEEKEEIKGEKDKFRQQLVGYKDQRTEIIKKKESTPWFSYWSDKFFDDGFKYIESNEHSVDDIKEQEEAYKIKWAQELIQVNYIFHVAPDIIKMVKPQLEEQVVKKQLTRKIADQFLNVIKNGEKELKLADENPSKYPFDYLKKRGEAYGKQLESLQKEVNGGPEVDVSKAPTSEDIADAEKGLKDAKRAEMSEFSVSRMTETALSTALSTFFTMLFIVFFLIGGTLAANDAIGRPLMYRILYFIYGGIFFPVTIMYYIYRWFMGTAPNIYRMIPVWTTPSTTTLGRFFLFPFTYTEDKAAKDAYIDYMKQAADLVGKKFTPPKESDMTSQLETVSKGLEAFAVAGTAAAGEAGAAAVKTTKETTEQISKALSGLTISK